MRSHFLGDFAETRGLAGDLLPEARGGRAIIVIIGLVVLIAAVAVAASGIVTNSGSAHPLGSSFEVLGLHLSGLSTGQLFMFGIVVGVVGMLGLSMLLGAFSRHLASRRSRRDLRAARRETSALREDRDRLNQELDEERTDRLRADNASAPGTASSFGIGRSAPALDTTAAHPAASPDPRPAGHPSHKEPTNHHSLQ